MKRSAYLPTLAGIVAIICLLGCISNECLGFWGNPKPTATVIDEETGKPIEGAVAIAIWRKHSNTERAWWEGGTDVVVWIEEAVSDNSGNLYIKGFWRWHLLGQDPHLTVYKFGYVCWDQQNVYIDEYNAPPRNDFDKDNRTARMRKWPEGFSFVSHGSFVYAVTRGNYSEAQKHLFREAFHSEIPLASNERTERDKKKLVEEQRRGGNE